MRGTRCLAQPTDSLQKNELSWQSILFRIKIIF